MTAIMHFAQRDCKRLLHNESVYAFCMETPNERLKQARIAAGYSTAREAAAALGMRESTYMGHENGYRGFPAKQAPKYARKFKVTEEWLLYGKGAGEEPGDPIPSVEVLEQMVREALEVEVTLSTPLADLPRVLGSNLREQLERFAADPGVVDLWAERLARGKDARSPAPTTEDAAARSRSA
jgi:transcriptional regulator with XRE-family HTH domain